MDTVGQTNSGDLLFYPSIQPPRLSGAGVSACQPVQTRLKYFCKFPGEACPRVHHVPHRQIESRNRHVYR
jgi:hypothetical protein